jgi:glycosyltransferase involved in cell wall biosynthesis
VNLPKYNVIVVGTSCFEGMASSKRIRNLLEPLIQRNLINVKNLAFQSETKQLIKKEGKIDDIDFKVIGYKLMDIFSVFNFYRQGLLYIKRNKQSNQKNILYNYGGPNIQNILFILYSKSIGFRIICDIVEDNRYEPTVGFLNKLKTRTSVSMLKLSKFYAHSLIGISEHLYNRLIHYSKEKVPVFLIPISVNLCYFKNQLGKEDKCDIKIFYGGSFNEKDGLDFLIDAFDKVSEKHKNVRLILTGTGAKPDIERAKNQINNAKNNERINYMGFLNTSDYFELLNECDIFCMTRIDSNHANTGFPFKLGEFLASGKAVIATRVGDVPNYLTDKVNALVIAPSSVNQLTEALLFLIENPDKREQIGKEGRKTAEYYFDSDKVSLKLFSIFESI